MVKCDVGQAVRARVDRMRRSRVLIRRRTVTSQPRRHRHQERAGPLFCDDVVAGPLGAQLLPGDRAHGRHKAPPRVVALDLGDGRGGHDVVCRHPRHQAALVEDPPHALGGTGRDRFAPGYAISSTSATSSGTVVTTATGIAPMTAIPSTTAMQRVTTYRATFWLTAWTILTNPFASGASTCWLASCFSAVSQPSF